MGEEAKQEQAPVEAQPEEKKQENPPPPPPPSPEAEKPPSEAETKAEEPLQAPPPFILYVELHCAGCAKKIERALMRIQGVEGVEIDMGQNHVSIKGVVEVEAVCNMIMKKTKRNVKILSPLPANPPEPVPVPDPVSPQVSGLNTVELTVNMHCEACAGQLKKKILKMKGVQTVETELNSGKVKVTGIMDENKLVDYVYRHTKKQARIVPQPQPEMPKPEEPKPEEVINEPEKPAEEPKPEEKTEEQQGGGGENKPPEEGPNKEGGEVDNGDGGMVMDSINNEEEESMKRSAVMCNYNYNYNTTPNYYNYEPIYFIDTTPPPQLFSDENPNACCVT